MLKAQVEKIPTGWKQIILDYIENNQGQWSLIEKKLDQDTYGNHLSIFPCIENIFRCFHYFEPHETQVVIIGQDPYHGKNQATGLSFAVKNDTKKPPSLKNIEKELTKDYNVSINDTSLENWAAQKVLMLNISLTVVEKKPRAHIKFWTPFTYHILHYITEMCNNIVFVAWGGFAFDVLASIQPDGNKEKNHKIVVTSHPSPLGYSKKMKGYHSFKDSKCFIKINSYLKKSINW
jgi:uracil-DNA glycosylase